MAQEHAPLSDAAKSILSSVGEHSGLSAMAGFNDALLTRPMTEEQRAVFAASVHEFNRNTASGIAVLVGRWTHHLMDTSSAWEATDRGGLVLSSALDEFGFTASGRGKNHALVLREFTEHLGLTPEKLEDPSLVVAGARELSAHIWDTYSAGDLDTSIAMHAASETTAPPEFASWQKAFLKFPEYGFDAGSETFKYIREHAAGLEEDHAADAQQALSEHLALRSTDPDKALQGAMRYLELYGHMAIELTTRIFPEVEVA